MEIKTFKRIINEALLENGFFKKGNYYYKNNEDLISMIGVQKSNFSLCYYINIGFIIKSLNSSMENLRDVDGDIRARFSLTDENKELDFFDLNKFKENDESKLRKIIEDNIKELIEPVASLKQLKILLSKNPIMLLQTKLNARKLLGFE